MSALVEAMEDPDKEVSQAALRTLTESLARWGISREKDTRDKLRAVAPRILQEAMNQEDVSALNVSALIERLLPRFEDKKIEGQE